MKKQKRFQGFQRQIIKQEEIAKTTKERLPATTQKAKMMISRLFAQNVLSK
jgi:hypothetical protein